MNFDLFSIEQDFGLFAEPAVAAEYLDDSHNASAKARERMYQPLDPMPKKLQEKMKEKIGVILTTF